MKKRWCELGAKNPLSSKKCCQHSQNGIFRGFCQLCHLYACYRKDFYHDVCYSNVCYSNICIFLCFVIEIFIFLCSLLPYLLLNFVYITIFESVLRGCGGKTATVVPVCHLCSFLPCGCLFMSLLHRPIFCYSNVCHSYVCSFLPFISLLRLSTPSTWVNSWCQFCYSNVCYCNACLFNFVILKLVFPMFAIPLFFGPIFVVQIVSLNLQLKHPSNSISQWRHPLEWRPPYRHTVPPSSGAPHNNPRYPVRV